jgi:hypothetical protein
MKVQKNDNVIVIVPAPECPRVISEVIQHVPGKEEIRCNMFLTVVGPAPPTERGNSSERSKLPGHNYLFYWLNCVIFSNTFFIKCVTWVKRINSFILFFVFLLFFGYFCFHVQR